jgi:hypothetical protein
LGNLYTKFGREWPLGLKVRNNFFGSFGLQNIISYRYYHYKKPQTKFFSLSFREILLLYTISVTSGIVHKYIVFKNRYIFLFALFLSNKTLEKTIPISPQIIVDKEVLSYLWEMCVIVQKTLHRYLQAVNLIGGHP